MISSSQSSYDLILGREFLTTNRIRINPKTEVVSKCTDGKGKIDFWLGEDGSIVRTIVDGVNVCAKENLTFNKGTGHYLEVYLDTNVPIVSPLYVCGERKNEVRTRWIRVKDGLLDQDQRGSSSMMNQPTEAERRQ